MVGSQGSIPRNTRTRRVLAVLAFLALIATACGGTQTETQTASSPEGSDVEYGSWNTPSEPDEPAADDGVDARTAGEAASSDSTDNTIEGDALGAPGSTDGMIEGGAVAKTPAQTAQVLAYAIQASEELSYSFEQGMSMRMSMLGMDLDIAPDAAFVTGEVSGTDSRVLIDMGAFMESMFESMGMDLSDPLFAGAFGDIDTMTMEFWVVDETMVIDMSGLAASIGDLDPVAAGEFGVFADGPVSIDLGSLGSLGSTDAAAMVQQFGQGTQVTDPAALVDALRAVDAVTEVGSSDVDGTPVTVYVASLSMAEYYDALGMDIADQLGAMEDFGIDPGSDEAAMVEAMLPAIEELTVDMTIMLDADGLVRRMETGMDMGAMMESMFGELDGGDAMGMGDIEIVVHTWQNFDDYGTDITITPPSAVDRTSELAGLIDA